MGKLRKFLNVFLGVVLLATLTGCGPEQSSLEAKNAETRARNEKLRRELSPIVGNYLGQMTGDTNRVIPIKLEIILITGIEEGRGAGEENTIPKLRSYFAEYDPEKKKDDFLYGVYYESNYTAESRRIILYNGNNNGAVANGIDAEFIPPTVNEPAKIQGFYIAPNRPPFKIRLNRVQE